MKKVHQLYRSVVIIAVVTTQVFATNIRPSYPTHFFFTPTPYLNNEGDLVISLHEISYTLPYKLQVIASLVDNVGRNDFGIRYALYDNMNFGFGIAHSFTTFDHGGHGIRHYDDARLGLFLACGIKHTRSFDATITPHAQLGKHKSLGADLGIRNTPNEAFSIIGEAGLSIDMTTSTPWLDVVAGTRIHPSSIPFLMFDVGIDLVESPVDHFLESAPFPYLDVVYTMKTK